MGSEVCMVWDVGMPFKGRIVHLMCDSGIEGLLYVEVFIEYAMELAVKEDGGRWAKLLV